MSIRQIQRLLSQIAAQPVESGPRIVGIDGGGGAGKTSLANKLREAAPSSMQCVHIDDFYWPRPDDSVRPNEPCWFFDWRRLRDEVLLPLKDGYNTAFRPYDWEAETLGEREIEVEARGIVIVEGISALRRELRPWIDFGIWVQAPPTVRLERGVARDGEDARATWVDYWMTEEARYFAEHQPHRFAHVLLSGESSTASSEDAAKVLLTGQRTLEARSLADSPTQDNFPFDELLRDACRIDADFVAPDCAGIDPGDFRLRHGSYGVIRDDSGAIATVQVDGCRFLPGGGWESGESALGALVREAREELGWKVRVDNLLGTASYRFRARRDDRFYRKVEFFYQATKVDAVAGTGESSHVLKWLRPDVAVDSLHEPSHRWAVEQGFE